MKLQVIQNVAVIKKDWLHWYKRFLNSKGSGTESMSNQQVANELHKPIIRIFKRRIVYSSFSGNI